MTAPRAYDKSEREKKKKKPVRTRALDVLGERVTEAPRASLARDPDAVAYRRQQRYARGEYPVASAEEGFFERTLRRILGIGE